MSRHNGSLVLLGIPSDIELKLTKQMNLKEAKEIILDRNYEIRSLKEEIKRLEDELKEKEEQIEDIKNNL